MVHLSPAGMPHAASRQPSMSMALLADVTRVFRAMFIFFCVAEVRLVRNAFLFVSESGTVPYKGNIYRFVFCGNT